MWFYAWLVIMIILAGTHVSEYLIVQDFVHRQHYQQSLVKKVVLCV